MGATRRDKKSILLVTFHFPPDAEVGAKRMARLANFLKNDGWDVGVLTVKERFYPQRDDSIVVDGVSVYRTHMIESARFLIEKIKRVFRRSRNGSGGEGGLNGGGGEGGPGGASRREKNERSAAAGNKRRAGVFSWLERLIISLIWCPDDSQGWIPFAFLKCLSLSRKYDIIYSSCPVFSANLVPLLTSCFRGRFRWVAEFRDPWTTQRKPDFATTGFTNWLERRWETGVMKRSSKIVVVNDAIGRDFIEQYPYVRDKVSVYYNGYDEDVLSSMQSDGSAERSGKITILHAGSFYHGRDPKLILEPLAALVDNGTVRKDEVEARFLGDSEYEGMDLLDLAKELRIDDIVVSLGQLPYRRCLEEIQRADILLLFNIDQPLQIPAKVFEYCAFRKRILSISTGGITDELIERMGIGISVRPDDFEGLKTAIAELIATRNFTANEKEIDRFKSGTIFKALTAELESLIT